MWTIDAEWILSIPISQHNMTDFIAWSYTKNGLFSVRSAYSVEWNYQYGSKLKYSNGMGRSTRNPIWCQIWKLSCPAKVKIFLWRTLHGTLPCRATLTNRHMKVSPLCPTCSQGVEDTKHLLFLCRKAKEVWKRLGLDMIIERACEIDRAGEAILEYLLLLPDQDLRIMGYENVREMVAISAWYLWWERRKLVHKEFT
uniref:Reverse transcriptase zinc-binding domain-containing protein n=1 Tax=Aegilops tauschii subsp. strangulata TaxID=200361 RepID=A0A453R7C6_AEGTS